MYLESLDLLSFRNYEKLSFKPSDGLNVLFGPNAQGKSAILEAVYMLATSKSHRTSHDADMIRIGQDWTRAAAQVSRVGEADVALELIISRTEKKSVKINGVKHRKMADLIGQLNAVIFSALDIEMVRGEPALRRRFLDLEICQISPQYVFSLARYNKAVEQRNALLRAIRDGDASASSLDGWDSQVAEYGGTVAAKRMEFCGDLSTPASEVYAFLTDSSEELRMAYKPCLSGECGQSGEEIAGHLKQELTERRDTDVARGVTTVGPHRDDLDIIISGLAAREFGSQGQQRSAALAIKLAEIDVVKERRGEEPVVLLDDAGAELDEPRRSRMMERISGRYQALITTANPDELGADLLSSAAMFEVKGGTVTPA